MTPHMGSQRIPTSMRLAIPRTPSPLTDEFLLPSRNMLFMDMLNQRVQITQIVRFASRPPTHSDLISAVATVFIILAAA